jgi:hypothetical protein
VAISLATAANTPARLSTARSSGDATAADGGGSGGGGGEDDDDHGAASGK